MSRRIIKRQFHVVCMKLGLAGFPYTKRPGLFVWGMKKLRVSIYTVRRLLISCFKNIKLVCKNYLPIYTGVAIAFFPAAGRRIADFAFKLPESHIVIILKKNLERMWREVLFLAEKQTKRYIDRMPKKRELRIIFRRYLRRSLSLGIEEKLMIISKLKIFKFHRRFLPVDYLGGILVVFFLLIIQSQLYKLHIVRVDSVQEDFVSLSAEESQAIVFDLDLNTEQSKRKLGNILSPLIKVASKGPQVVIEDYRGNRIESDYTIEELDEDTFRVNITPGMFPPGEYQAKLGVEKEGIYYESQHRFSYGVLAINTNKTQYLPAEKVYIQMASLRNDGHTVCDSDLVLTVIDPAGGESILPVERSGKCQRNNVTDIPDYFSYFDTSAVGHYKLILRNNLNEYKIEDSFEVVEEVPFVVERMGPTRIYPFVPYKFTIRIKTLKAYKGVVTEKVPATFLLNREAVVDDKWKNITWDVELEAGQSVDLSYEFDAPDVSPELYFLGPLAIGDYIETREWQIAGDADETVVFTIPGSTSWTVPGDVTSITVETWGAGGGGKGGTLGIPGGGGGGGAYSREVIAVTPSTSFNAVVGSGGSAGTANGGNGGNGGSSSFSANTTNTTANGGSGATTTSGGTAGTSNVNADFSYAGGTGGNGHQTSLTYVGSASAATTAVSFPAHKKGDLIIIMAFRDGSATLPTIPAGWMVLETSTTTSASSVLAYKVANNSSETSGTWTSATEVAVQIYRGHAGIGIWGGSGAVSSIISYPAISLTVADGSSWVAGFAAHRSATNVEGNPWGMVNRTSAGSEIAGHDTNGGVSSWPLSTVVVGASSGWLSWVVEIKAATTSSPSVSYVASATGVTSLTMPAHQVGDLLMMFAYRENSNTAATVPTGWRVWGTAAGASTNSSVGAYKIAKTTSETSGTWTNATGVEVHVYRGHGGFGAVADTGGASTTVTYAALTMQVADGSSRVAGFSGHRSIDTNLQNPPSGMTNRATYVDTVNEIAGHDTAGGVASWSNTNVSVGGTSSGWRAKTVEIKSAVQGFGAGGGASSAGNSSAGTSGNNNTDDSGGGTATAPTGGGNGGAGGDDSLSGTGGSAPGGAGGGGGNLTTSGNAGGAGANGKVSITYTLPTYINIQGTCKQSDNINNCTDVGSLRVAVNGTLKAQTQETVAGSWTISGILQPQNGDVITVFIDAAGESDEAVAVTTYDGSDNITGMQLIAQRLSIGNADNRTITNVNLSQYDNSVSGNENIFYEVDGANDFTMVETGKTLVGIYIKSGNTYRPASDNTGNVTVNDFEIPTGGIFTGDGNTITVTGDGTPFIVAGTFNENTTTFRYTSTLATTITPETYYHLHLQPSGVGSPTYSLGVGAINTQNLVVGDGTNALTVNWTTYDPSINVGGNLTLNVASTWTKSNVSVLTFNNQAVSPSSLIDNNSSKQDLGKLKIDAPKEIDLGSSVTVESMEVTTGDTLDLQSSGYTLKITGSGTSSSRPFKIDGNLTEGNATVEYLGLSATDVDDDTYYNLYLNRAGTTFTSNGDLAITNIFTINAGTFQAGSNTLTLSGSGTPFVVTGSFLEGTSTVSYTGTTSTNITADTYNILQIGYTPLSSSVIYTSPSGTINVLSTLDIGYTSGSGTATLQVDTHDSGVDVGNNFSINTKGSYSASSNTATPLSVAGNFTNNGSFLHNNGKVILDGAIDTSQSVLGTANFYNLEAQTGDREIKFGASGTRSIVANGSFTLTGTSCDNMARIRSTSSGSQSTLSIDPSAVVSVSHVDLQDINLINKSITAANSVNSGNNSANWLISANACLGTSSNANPIGSSFQRKVIYDDQNANYWSFNHDGDEIEIKYSSDEGSTWANPTTSISGRLPYDTNDFSVWWKSLSGVEYIVLAVADGGDIKVRLGVLSANNIVWDTDISVAINEGGIYSSPYIALDSSNHIWVGATYYDSPDYSYKVVTTVQDISMDPSSWTWTGTPYEMIEGQTNSNVYGTITPLSDGDMYATFVVNTSLVGCRWHSSSSLWKNSDGDECMGSTGTEYFSSLSAGLVAHWEMDEASWNGSTGEVLDSSSSAYNGTSNGGATTVAKGFVRAGNFAGDNDFINAGDIAELNSVSAFSVSQWAYITDVSASDRIFHKAIDGNNDISIAPFYQTTQRIFVDVGNGSNSYGYWDSTGTISNNTWNHIVAAYDGSGSTNSEKLKLYVNGLERSLTFNGTIPASTANLAGSNLRLGSGASTEYFAGRLDEVRIYSRAITSEEVSKLYEYTPGAVNIDDTGDFGSLSGSGRQIVRTKSGILYALLKSGDNCTIWKSVNGIKWVDTDTEACDEDESMIAMAIDSNDDIHVVYSDSIALNALEWVKYSTFTDTFGTSERVVADNSSNNFQIHSVSISLDSSNVPHVAYSLLEDDIPTCQLLYRNRLGGVWQTQREIESVGSIQAYVSVNISINKDNIAEIAYINSIDSDLTLAIGNANNASSFTMQDVDTSVNIVNDQLGTSIMVNHITGDTWAAYVDSDNDIALAKHVNTDNWATWSTVTTKTDEGYKPSITSDNGHDMYVLYEDDTGNIAYDLYDATDWSGPVVLNLGAAQGVSVKWSSRWNNFGSNKIDYLYSDGTDLYYDSFVLRRSPTNIDNTSDFGSLPNGGREVVRTSSGDLYALLNDQGNCEIWKSMGENLWVELAGNQCDTNSPLSLVVDAQDNLQAFYANNSGGNLIERAEFYTELNTFGVVEQIKGNSNLYILRIVASLDHAGNLHLAWIERSDTNIEMVKYKNNIGYSWNTEVQVAIDTSPSYATLDFTLNDGDIPEIIYLYESSSLNASVGNQNNATSFTTYGVDSSVNFVEDETGISIGVSSLTGDTWVSYTDATTNYITLVQHTGSNWVSNWTNAMAKTDVGYEPSIAVQGADVYVFYINDQGNSVYDKYQDGTWTGERVLETHGALQDLKPKWSYVNNYDSTGSSPVRSDTYYFDASDEAVADVDNVWAGDTGAFDSSLGTSAYVITFNGDIADYFLFAGGTNAIDNGGTISKVKARIYGGSDWDMGQCSLNATIFSNGLNENLGYAVNTFPLGSPAWSPYSELLVPGDGWTWEEIQSLEVKVFAYNDGSCSFVEEARVYKVEIIVESTNANPQEEIDYIYSDGSDVFYNRLLIKENISLGEKDIISDSISSGLNKNFSAVGDTVSTADYIHLAYVNSSGQIYYERYDGDWNYAANSLDGDTDNTYLSLSLDSSTNDAYLGYIASGNDDIYMKKATYSAGPSWSWGTGTVFKTDASEIFTNYTSNYSSNGKLGSILTIGDLSPYHLDWETILSMAPNSAPTIESINVNGGSNINLTENSTVNVSWAATVRDDDGYAQISGVTGKLYKSNVSGAEACTNNNNDCYEDLSCDLTGCSGDTCTATCTSAVYFHAEATDANSGQSSLYWRGWIEATDSNSANGEGFSAANAPDINSLAALDIAASIDYGLLIPNDNSVQQSTLITNTGNVIIDTQLSGDNMCVDYPTCASYSINVGQQEYSMAGFSYGSGTDLTSSNVRIQLNLAKSLISPSNSSANLYWRLGVPALQALGEYSGENTVIVVNDNL